MSQTNDAKRMHWNQEREDALADLVGKLGTKKWAIVVDRMKALFPGFNQNPKQ